MLYRAAAEAGGKFKKEAKALRGVYAEKIMSLRLDQSTRVYGVRQGNCLNLLFFDPDRTDKDKCCYDFN